MREYVSYFPFFCYQYFESVILLSGGGTSCFVISNFKSSKANTMFFGGVEGGATHSNLVICDERGHVLGTAQGPETNHWMVGMDGCAERVLAMLHEAKNKAGIPIDTPLDALGLALSGCEQESSNKELAARVIEKDANSARAVIVQSDTAGSLATAAPNGGMVLIAGTGSNCFIRTPSGKQHGCGGWGYLLGDEGGAYWIAHRAIKAIFDDMDGMHKCDHPTEKVWKKVKEYFAAENQADLLPHVYKHFDKSFFSGFTLKLSELANEGDSLSRHIFAEAGGALAAHAAALIQKCDMDRLRVVCVGSVWKSWEHLKPGWLSELAARGVKAELELVRLRVSSALGAAWLAAKEVNYELPHDDSAYCDIFYTYHPEDHSLRNGDHKPHNGVANGAGDAIKNGTS